MPETPDRDTMPRLPGGGALAPGEAVVVGERFMLSTVVFYLHTEIALTNRRLYAMRPSMLLGLIPVGTARSNFPVENIAGVSAATRFDVLGVLVGGLAILVGLAGFSSPQMSAFGVPLIVIGVLLIIAAPKQACRLSRMRP